MPYDIRIRPCSSLLVALIAASSAIGASPRLAISTLQKECAACHGAAAMSGLNLTSREAVLKGGTRGPALIPGFRGMSILYQAILRGGELKMPPGEQSLSKEQIEAIGAW